MRVEKRIPPVAKPCRRLLPKIPNPLPNTTNGPIKAENKCLFYDLRSKCAAPPSSFEKLPPILRNPIGKPMTNQEIEKMRQLRLKNSNRWTITALSKEFGIHRGFIIRNVLTADEQKQAEDELVERIDSMSLLEKRGWLMRYKIREHRRDLW